MGFKYFFINYVGRCLGRGENFVKFWLTHVDFRSFFLLPLCEIAAFKLSLMPPPSTPGGGSLRASRSNPDISANSTHQCSTASGYRHSSLCTNGGSDIGAFGGFGGGAEQMLKVYRADQSFRYLSVLPEHTAKQLVLMALHVI